MFTPEDWVALITKLIEKTRANRARWEFNDADGVYLVVGSIIYVIHPRDGDGVAPWRLRVNRSTGPGPTEFIALDDLTTERDQWGTDLDPAKDLLDELRQLAFKSAAGGADLVEKLVEELDNLD